MNLLDFLSNISLTRRIAIIVSAFVLVTLLLFIGVHLQEISSNNAYAFLCILPFPIGLLCYVDFSDQWKIYQIKFKHSKKKRKSFRLLLRHKVMNAK